jgi:DNA-binding LacI/PurR family transcriptional regulator
MGRISANLLLDMIEGRRARDGVEDVVVAPALVVRQSTAPAAASG